MKDAVRARKKYCACLARRAKKKNAGLREEKKRRGRSPSESVKFFCLFVFGVTERKVLAILEFSDLDQIRLGGIVVF